MIMIRKQFNTSTFLPVKPLHRKPAYFSTSRCLLNPSKLEKKLKLIENEIRELEEATKILQEDYENIAEGMSAASKVATETPLTTEDKEVLEEYKANYPTFFESSDEEAPTSKLNKFKQVSRYIASEIGVNKKSMEALIEKHTGLATQTESQIEQASSSTTDSTNQIVEASSSKTVAPSQAKRKAEDFSESEESLSTKKTRSTPTSDYIDDLPDLPYNPFDDIGFD